jgi:hypothetical protein
MYIGSGVYTMRLHESLVVNSNTNHYLAWCLYSRYKCMSLVAYASNCWLVILVFTNALFTCAILDFVQDLIRMHIKWLVMRRLGLDDVVMVNHEDHGCIVLNQRV